MYLVFLMSHERTSGSFPASHCSSNELKANITSVSHRRRMGCVVCGNRHYLCCIVCYVRGGMSETFSNIITAPTDGLMVVLQTAAVYR